MAVGPAGGWCPCTQTPVLDWRGWVDCNFSPTFKSGQVAFNIDILMFAYSHDIRGAIEALLL